MRVICLFLFVSFAGRLPAQAPPSKEGFVDEVLSRMDSNGSGFYLIAGSDTCRFEKFDYDEWVKYHLQASVPLTTLNELAYKVHLARQPYFWQQARLKRAKCINAGTADSLLATRSGYQIFSLSQPQFTDDGQFAVIDINWKRDLIRGGGYTLLFRRTPDGWRSIGTKQNWGNNQ